MLALLALATVALFMLLHPYRGLVHDGRLYTIQALSHLDPGLYGNDIFVSMGSQDDYTLFSPIYATAIAWFGVESAAAIITLCAIMFFLCAAWLLARHLLTSALQATVALLLLVMLPSDYGPSRIFHYLEEFITPRQLAEAFTLLCLLAWFSKHRLLALLFAAAALLIHPIIGLMGICLLPVIEWTLPNWRKLLPLALVVALATLVVLLGWLPITRWQFDTEWHRIVMNRTYLSLLNWTSEDWARIATVFATLLTAATHLRGKLQQVSTGAAVATASLLLLALIGGDLLRVTIVVQAQPWRVLWLATVLAIMLLPPLFIRNWQGSPLTRCALLLLAATWTASHAPLALVTAPLAVIAALFAQHPLPPRQSQLLLFGSWAALCIAGIYTAATSHLTLSEGLVQLDRLPAQLDKLLTFSQSGLFPALLLLGGAWLAMQRLSRGTWAALATGLIVVIALLAVPVAKTWAAKRYEGDARAAFAEWRALIPEGHEVLWIEDDAYWGDGATNTWLLLERPSFMSSSQAPNALFSRAAALEMHARANSLWGLVPFVDPFRAKGNNVSAPKRPLQLAPVCQTTAVRYLVTREIMADATPIPAPASTPLFLRDYKLYICHE